jgi:hypothetical protein
VPEKGKPVARRQPPRETDRAVDQAAAPVAGIVETSPSVSGAVVVLVPLFVLGLILLGAASVPPARLPWPVVSEPLYVHRSNLAAIGVGTIALALLCLNIAVLL